MGPVYRVTIPGSLQRVLAFRRHSKVLLELPSLTPVEAAALESQIDRLLGTSGHPFAAIAAFASLAGCLFFDLGYWPVPFASKIVTILLNLLVCSVATAIGKLAGLFLARWRLARLLWRIQAILVERSPPDVSRPGHLGTRAF